MQAAILFIGVLLFVYHIFVPSPVFFNEQLWAKVDQSQRRAIEEEFTIAQSVRRDSALSWLLNKDLESKQNLLKAHENVVDIRNKAKTALKTNIQRAELKDGDYIFVQFVQNNLPIGLVGLLVAVILSAAMSSTASELNALGTTTMIDFVGRIRSTPLNDAQGLLYSKLATGLWGGIALAFALFASLFDNLIEAVNILGSLFYGTMLGIFVLAIFFSNVGSIAALIGGVVGLCVVISLFLVSSLGFLWYNVIGCLVVVAAALGISLITNAAKNS